MYQASYLDFHLSMQRGLLEEADEAENFDALDAFTCALEDWERDTDRGALEALHQDALCESLFEVSEK